MARIVHSTKSGHAKTSKTATQAGAHRSSQHANMKGQPSVRKGKKLNVWLESRMKSAIEEFHKGGFCESGIFPVNRNAIRPEVFEPSKTSDRPLISEASTSAEAPNEPSSAIGSATASSESVTPNEPSSASGTDGPGGKQCSGLIGLRSHLFQLSYPRLLF